MSFELMLEQMEKQVLPHVISGIRDADTANGATMTPDGDNFSDSRIYGLSCYWLIMNRILQCLPEDSGFRIIRNRNILRLVWNDGTRDFVFLILKVAKDSRLFTGAKSVKVELRRHSRQGSLMPELEKYDMAPYGYVNNLGYDASCEGGLGALTLDRVRHKCGDEFEAETLHEFGTMDGEGEGSGGVPPKGPSPEKIRRHSLAFHPPQAEDEDAQ